MRFVVSVEEKREMLCKPKRVPSELTRLILKQHPRQLGSKSGHHSRRTDGRDRDDSDTGKRRQNQEARDLYLYKSKGQHILTNPRVLDKIVRTSSIKTSDTVLEIGPGTGNLTLRLLDAAKEVVAVEIDTRMVEILNKRVAEHGFQDKLNVICKDALRTEFPKFDLVVANIPYGISSPLVIKLVYGLNPFRSATLLLQKEFARRLLAKPGDSEFNRLAVNVKLVAEVEFLMDVSKRDFLPCPKVDSSVVIIRPKADIPDVNLQEWWAFTRTCFNKKNRTLGATLKQKKKVLELLRLSKMTGFRTETADNGCEYFECNSDSDDTEEVESGEGLCSSSSSQMELSLFKEKVIEVLNSGGFDKKRPSKLSNEELLQLLSSFNQAGIYFHDQAKSKDAKNVALAATFSS